MRIVAASTPLILVLTCSCGGIASRSGVGDGGSRDGSGLVDGASEDARRDSAARRDAITEDARDASADARRGCDSGLQGVQCIASDEPQYVNAAALAVDDQNVYWAVFGQGDQGAILSAPRAGGPVVTLATGPTASSMASDDAALYWVAPIGNEQTSVFRVPAGGGMATTLTTVPGYPYCLAMDATNVYWTEGNEVLQVAKTGGAVHTLATSTDGAYGIVAGPTDVYWGAEAGGILSSPLDGGASTTLFAGSSASPCGSLSLVDDDLVTIVAPAGGEGTASIVRVPTSGATAPSVVVSAGNPYLVTSDEQGFFWAGYESALAINDTSFDGGTTTLAEPDAQMILGLALASDGALYWLTNTQVQSIKP